MNTGIEKVIKDGNGNAIIYTALLAALAANAIPTPMDAIYFSRQQKLKARLERGEISVNQYWYKDVGEYYVWTAAWYAGIFTVLMAAGGSYKTNARILLGMAGAGLVVGVMFRNIQKDKEIAGLKSGS